ncbi:MAG: hypothetical protein KDB23_07885, partial [Planctomycetales bacterium]|nr:hypothetical protein [Planctomycetales bacterium]
ISRLIEALVDLEKNPWRTKPYYLNGQQNTADRLQEKLHQPFALLPTPTTLGAIIETLCVHYNLPIVVDRAALDDAGITLENCTVNFHSPPTSVQEVLLFTLMETELTALSWEGVLCVTTHDAASNYTNVAAFPIHDLLQRGFTFDDLAVLIQSTIDPDTWDSVGGPGSVCLCGKAAILSQKPEVLQKIERLLTRMRTALTSLEIDRPSNQASANRNVEPLQRTVSLHRSDLPLRNLLRELLSEVGLTMLIQSASLDKYDLFQQLAVPTSVDVDAERLQTVLDRLLANTGLAANYWTDNIVLLTASHDISFSQVVQVYNVEHLISHGSLRSLKQMITDTIGPGSWDDGGGEGSIFEGNGLLVVNATPAIQWEIGELLTGLNEARDAYDRDELVVYRQQNNPYSATESNARAIRVYRTGRDRPASWASPRKSRQNHRVWEIGEFLAAQMNDDGREFENHVWNVEIAIENHEFLVLSCTDNEHELAERYLQLVTRPAASDNDRSVVSERAWELLTPISSDTPPVFAEAQRDLSELHQQLRFLPAHPNDSVHPDFLLALDLRQYLARGLSQLSFQTSTLYYADWLWVRTDSAEHLVAARDCIDQQLALLSTILQAINTSVATPKDRNIADRLLEIAIDDATPELNDCAAWLLAVAGQRNVKLSAESVQNLASNAQRIAPDLRQSVLKYAQSNDPRDIAPLIPLLTENLRTRSQLHQSRIIKRVAESGIAGVTALCDLLSHGSYELENEVVVELKHITEQDERALPLIVSACLKLSYTTQRDIAAALAGLPQRSDQLRRLIQEYDRRADPDFQRQWQRFRTQLQIELGENPFDLVVPPNEYDSSSSDAVPQP